MIGRRRFFGVLGGGAIGARAAADQAAARLARVSQKIETDGLNPQALPSAWPMPDARQAFLNPFTRRAVEELLYREECKCVWRIDPDLAVMKSLSLNAKITFQRQRNVAEKIEQMQGISLGKRIHDLITNLFVGVSLDGQRDS